MHDVLSARIEAIEGHLARRLHLRRTALPGMLRAARGRLPRPVLRQARELATAKAALSDPAAAQDLNLPRIAATCDLMERALAAVPEGRYRRRARAARIAGAALNLLAVAGLFWAVLLWRGGA